MAGRRLAVALPTTAAPPAPPPPRSSSVSAEIARNGRRRSPSLASLLSGDFVSRPRYRCCCRLLHLRTASFFIGIADTLGMSAAFGRGLHLGLSMQHNPMAIGWFVISSLMFILGFMCTLAMFYGVWRERYLWIVPKLVMKISAIVLYSSVTVAMVYMMMEHSQYLLDLVAEHVTKSDYESARLALRTGGGGLAVAFLLMALTHVWFFYILYRCYKYLKDRYFWKKSRLANSESNDNHLASVLANFTSSTSPSRSGGPIENNYTRSPARFDTDSRIHSSSPSGRNGNVRRANSSETYENNHNRMGGFENFQLQSMNSSTIPPRSHRHSVRYNENQSMAVPCSCHSPILGNSITEREGLWRGLNQTHV